jgi:hypothetical protein
VYELKLAVDGANGPRFNAYQHRSRFMRASRL